MARNREQFTQAENEWDLKNLYEDLASVKGKNLTPIEKLHLRGLLCGYSPTEIAEKLCKTVNGVEVDLSHTVYQYVKDFMNRDCEEEKQIEKIGNWRNICQWLEEEGYKCQQTTQSQSSQPLPAPVDAKVHVSNITTKKHQLIIGFNIQLITPLPPDYPKEEPPQ
jgi:hypothetical protein